MIKVRSRRRRRRVACFVRIVCVCVLFFVRAWFLSYVYMRRYQRGIPEEHALRFIQTARQQGVCWHRVYIHI